MQSPHRSPRGLVGFAVALMLSAALLAAPGATLAQADDVPPLGVIISGGGSDE